MVMINLIHQNSSWLGKALIMAPYKIQSTVGFRLSSTQPTSHTQA